MAANVADELKSEAGGGAGGGAITAGNRARHVDQVGPELLKYMKTVYDECVASYGISENADGAVRFIHGVQQRPLDEAQTTAGQLGGLDFEEFKQLLTGTEGSDVIAEKEVDDSYDISNYFISSSHNTYLTGNQLSSDSSPDAYKNVLRRGCRCVEVDVWDGDDPSDSEAEGDQGKEKKLSLKDRLKNKLKSKDKKDKAAKESSPSPPPPADRVELEHGKIKPWSSTGSEAVRAEPKVLHGYTATKAITFRSVCEAIREHAFETSNLPVVVSLEVHTSHSQQEIMVDIMKECWGDMLANPPQIPENGSELDVPLPVLKDLHRKILIKVKYSPPKPPPTEEQVAQDLSKLELSSSASSSDEEKVAAAKRGPEQRKAKILEALSRLGVYTRSYHFGGFDTPEAKVPTHIFSLSEGKLMEVHETTPGDLFQHNKSYLMRAYPKGTRVSSTNLDPAIFWRKGVQVVALNWQKLDAGMMLNEAMFAETGGWVLKPEGYRSVSRVTSQKDACNHGILDLRIEFIAGQNVPMPPDEDHTNTLKPYVKCELHVERPEERGAAPIPGGGKVKDGEYKLKTKTAKGINPDFKREILHFENVPGVAPELSFLRLKVMDDERLRDDLTAWACYRLDRLPTGFRMLHLFDCNGVMTNGVLWVRITKSWKPEGTGS